LFTGNNVMLTNFIMCCSSWSDMFIVHIDIVSAWSTVKFFIVRVFIINPKEWHVSMSCKITLISTFDVNQNFDFAFVCLNAAKESCVTLNVEINSWLFVFFFLCFLSIQTTWWQWCFAW
jgi:hypothetical protein